MALVQVVLTRAPTGRSETSALGYTIARRMLGDVLGSSPAEVPLGVRPDGRPVVGRDDGPPVDLSIAHCRSHLLVGVSEGAAIGVDVEPIRPIDPRVERRVLTEAEQQALEGLAGHERAAAFARLWTVKEACIKAMGRPLAGAWRAVEGTLHDRGSWEGIRWTRVQSSEVAATVALRPLGDYPRVDVSEGARIHGTASHSSPAIAANRPMLTAEITSTTAKARSVIC